MIDLVIVWLYVWFVIGGVIEVDCVVDVVKYVFDMYLCWLVDECVVLLKCVFEIY